MKRFLLILALATSGAIVARGADKIEPDGTYIFAQRDTCDLFLDIYEPDAGSITSIDGKSKPTIIFIFGGGFVSGKRDGSSQQQWFKLMCSHGYRIIAIDYRLGLKGAKMSGLQQVSNLRNAISIAVEDLFSATAFIVENAAEFGIDPDNIVVSGSSAGAITALQADYEICNRTELTKILPKGFRYAGVMSFSGAVFSSEGVPKYELEPAPTMMLHGTADKMVVYNQIWFMNFRFAGTNVLTPIFEKNGYNYNTLRFKDRGHEICNAMVNCIEEELIFLEKNVIGGSRRIVDSIIDDPDIHTPEWAHNNAHSIYN